MRMKSMLALVLLGAACRSGYKEEATATPAPGAAPGTYAPAVTAPPASGPTFVAQVVTIDTGAPSVTLRETAVLPDAAMKTSAPELKPGDRTLRIEGTAATMVTTVKAGDQVRVSCREFMGTTDTTGAAGTSGAKATSTPATGMSAEGTVSASVLG